MKTIKSLCILARFVVLTFTMIGCKNKTVEDSSALSSHDKRSVQKTSKASEESLMGPFATQVSYTCDPKRTEPKYQSQPISLWIQNTTELNPMKLPLSDLLSLKCSNFDEEWGTARFELPIRYKALRKDKPLGGDVELGWLNEDGDFVQARFEDSEPGKNGSCVVWWGLNWDAPGRHALRARLTYHDNLSVITIIGPPMPFDSTNVCQFVEGSTFFDSEGTQLYAKLRSSTADFRVEISTSEGKHLKTITGATKIGQITNEWNLISDDGKKFGGDAFVAAFHIMYPDDQSSRPPAKVTFTRIADVGERPKK